jgi:hypothetical protein
LQFSEQGQKPIVLHGNLDMLGEPRLAASLREGAKPASTSRMFLSSIEAAYCGIAGKF